MENEELEQQDKQEQKEDGKEKRKQTLKVAITSSFCTLLFIVILLLLILLCLRNCSKKQSGDNSSSSNEPTWTEYDNPRLNNVFKEIVNTYIEFNDVRKDLKDVMMAKYALKEDNKFDLSICVTSNAEDKYVYYYEVENESYAGFTDPFTFLLDEHTDLFLDETARFETYKLLDTTINTDKSPNRYIVVSNLANTSNYFFGSYYDSGLYQYHIYDKVEYTDGENPFNNDGEIIATDSLLFGYYHSLYA